MSIYQKIANIQDKVQNITKDGKNPHFSNTYATYEQVMGVLHPLLRSEKLMICHAFENMNREGIVTVTTHVVDLVDDKKITSNLEMPMTKNDPQMAGSAITYAKRYSVLAMFGLGTEDDDGEKAVSKPVLQPVAPPAPKQDDNFEGKVPCNDCGAETTYKEGISKAGKPYKGYFCTQSREHKPFFVN